MDPAQPPPGGKSDDSDREKNGRLLEILKHASATIDAIYLKHTGSPEVQLFILNRSFLDRLTGNPAGVLAVLSVAAFLEAWGDSFFQSGFYRSTGAGRVVALVGGVLVLAAYGSVVNVPRWDFGRLIGAYVVLFFLMAQVIAKVRFGESPTLPIYVGGTLIAAGGLLIAWVKQ